MKSASKITLTFDELDEECQRLENLPYQCGDWWPTMEEVQEIIEPDIKKYVEFAIWITETACAPRNDEEKAVKKYLLKLINNSIKVDDGV